MIRPTILYILWHLTNNKKGIFLSSPTFGSSLPSSLCFPFHGEDDSKNSPKGVFGKTLVLPSHRNCFTIDSSSTASEIWYHSSENAPVRLHSPSLHWPLRGRNNQQTPTISQPSCFSFLQKSSTCLCFGCLRFVVCNTGIDFPDHLMQKVVT